MRTQETGAWFYATLQGAVDKGAFEGGSRFEV
jgi:hypothetical protein